MEIRDVVIALLASRAVETETYGENRKKEVRVYNLRGWPRHALVSDVLVKRGK